MDNARYMRRAISVAARTNPAVISVKVGAVLVNYGYEFEGSKEFAFNVYGTGTDDRTVLHAERVAIYRAGGMAKDSTLYLTIEPCVKSEDSDIPSCSELIVDSKIGRVVIGMLDPNLDIKGLGFEYLKSRDIDVRIFRGLEHMILPLLYHERLDALPDGNGIRLPGDDHRRVMKQTMRRFRDKRERISEREMMDEMNEF